MGTFLEMMSHCNQLHFEIFLNSLCATLCLSCQSLRRVIAVFKKQVDTSVIACFANKKELNYFLRRAIMVKWCLPCLETNKWMHVSVIYVIEKVFFVGKNLFSSHLNGLSFELWPVKVVLITFKVKGNANEGEIKKLTK